MRSETPWIQVLGRTAVHRPGLEVSRLPGSAQRLLSVLVAAGPDGMTAERIAEGIWTNKQPNPWRPALRMAVARLRKQLPDGWTVTAESGEYRLDPADGWVDAWDLMTVAAGSAPVIEADLKWILAGEPYADVDMLDTIGAGPEHLRLLQLETAERFCDLGPEALTAETCSLLSSLLRQQPYNDRLAMVIGRCLIRADRRPEAQRALTAFVATFEEEFHSVPDSLTSLLDSTSQNIADLESTGQNLGGPLGADLTSDQAAIIAELPRELRHLGGEALVGRRNELGRLTHAETALLLGAAGSGKSRLLAELISTDLTRDTTYVVGDDGLDLELGPFAIAVPALRESLVAGGLSNVPRGRHDGSESRAASTRAWQVVLQHFESAGARRPQRLIVDDAHLLDHASLGLLRLLIRSNTSTALAVTVSGRSDIDDATWADFQREAARAGVQTIELGSLSLNSLEKMISSYFPGVVRELVRGLGIEVLEASGGLPGVARPLIEAADKETLSLPEQIQGASALGGVAASLTAPARDVAAAAAILGREFSIGSLLSLVDLDESTVFAALDEMWAASLIGETDDPDRIRFRHVLVQSAFVDVLPGFRRTYLHKAASELTDDPHERAWHQASAGSLIEPEVAASSLVKSAELLVENSQWRRAARQLRRAEALIGDRLDESALSLWAAALDKSGADGTVPRRAAYKKALANRNWDGALAAATAGLPEAELPDGDPERIRMLEGIPPDELPNDLLFDRVLHLARQHAVGGNRDVAVVHADHAIRLANGPDEIALSHVSRWTATRHLSSQTHVFPAEVRAEGSLSARTRMAQMSAIGAIEAGHYSQAQLHARQFEDLAAELGDPIRIWHSMVLQVLFAIDEGDLAVGSGLSDQAAEYAQMYGLQQGATAWAAAQYHLHSIRGRAADLWPILSSYRANVERSSLGVTAMVLVQAAANEGDPTEEIRTLVVEALELHRTSALLVLAMLCPVVPRYVPELCDDVAVRLEPFLDNSLVLGYGVANIGPTARYAAALRTGKERVDLLRRAVVIADDHQARLWRVLTRVDLATFDGPEHLVEAAELAAGTALAGVVPTEVG